MIKYIGFYLVIINICTYFLFAIDKRRAIQRHWRVRERTLLIFCLFGGSIGGLAAMYLLRHKTKHRKFSLGVPAILALQIIAGIMFYQYWL